MVHEKEFEMDTIFLFRYWYIFNILADLETSSIIENYPAIIHT